MGKIDIITRNMEFRDRGMVKLQDESHIENNGPFFERHGEVRTVAMDKGIVAMEENIRCISPNKNPDNQKLSIGQMERNNRHGMDRVLFEKILTKIENAVGNSGKKHGRVECIIIELCKCT